MTQRVYLIGYMGSGKSTMGRWIAEAMNWNFIDLDHYIENKYHKTIPQIFEEDGETHFRKIESICLKEVSDIENIIIGAGGGTPCFFDNMELMNQTGLSIYLHLTPQVVFDRLMTSKNKRPLIEGKSGEELLQFISEKLEERELYYNKAQVIAEGATWTVEDFLKVIQGA
ncbi:shikimate kinase [Saccharicrinis aurantiacus]|uniref:shikimate kinase n=1 Tax=Saccharicrinis aurantiacus TaxID=1849719 RepID=UPI002491B2AD|nr:shikimate kinase [Saccharicrinis aurantiacus]